MTIKMDVHSIANAGGGGAELRYVKLLPAPVRSRAQLKEAISHRCQPCAMRLLKTFRNAAVSIFPR